VAIFLGAVDHLDALADDILSFLGSYPNSMTGFFR
jgi:hypothetical protein